jgi:hypothetical protein
MAGPDQGIGLSSSSLCSVRSVVCAVLCCVLLIPSSLLCVADTLLLAALCTVLLCVVGLHAAAQGAGVKPCRVPAEHQ